jgi:hypothetical protein
VWNNQTNKDAVIRRLENAIMQTSCNIEITIYERDYEPLQMLSVSHMAGLRRSRPFSGAHLRNYLNSALSSGSAAFAKWYIVDRLPNLPALLEIIARKYAAAKITHVWSHFGGNSVCVEIHDLGQAIRFRLEYENSRCPPQGSDLEERS